MKKAKIIISLVFMACTCLLFAALLHTPYLLIVAVALFIGCLAVSFGMTVPGMALTLCGSIGACLKPTCAYPLTNGLEVEVYLCNKADFDDLAQTTTFTSVNPLLVTAWVAAAPYFYTYEGLKTSNNRKDTLVNGKFTSSFSHELNTIVFNVSVSAKTEMEALAKGLVIAIIKNKYKGAGNADRYEVLGLGQGLSLVSMERDSNNADTLGGYAITLKTPDGLSEPHLPATIYATGDTDGTATQSMVDALLVTSGNCAP